MTQITNKGLTPKKIRKDKLMANTADKPVIDILLSTYNGGLYLKEQLDSLLSQIYKNWSLIVRDDGSSDNTVEIIKEHCKKYPERITFIEDNMHLGACRSFIRLLEGSSADYVMFCDQDDVWLSDKIDITLKAMQEIESEHGDIPILVHTDLKVVDQEKNLISESFWRYQHLDPHLKSLNTLLVLNNVTGCTMMINSKLKKLVASVPEGAILHDWWIALVASAFGKIEYVSVPTMLYRQHGKNEAGAVSYSLSYFSSRVRNLGASIDLARRIVEQGRSFLMIYGDRISKADREIVYNFSTLFQQWKIKRLFTLLRFRLKTYGFLRNLGISTLFLLLSDKGSSKALEYR